MDIDEMAEFLGKLPSGEPCENCPIMNFKEIITCDDCVESFKQWLESEEE